MRLRVACIPRSRLVSKVSDTSVQGLFLSVSVPYREIKCWFSFRRGTEAFSCSCPMVASSESSEKFKALQSNSQQQKQNGKGECEDPQSESRQRQQLQSDSAPHPTWGTARKLSCALAALANRLGCVMQDAFRNSGPGSKAFNLIAVQGRLEIDIDGRSRTASRD